MSCKMAVPVLNAPEHVRMGLMIESEEGISEEFCIEWETGSSLGVISALN